ncbi:PadR family transcriptional regulator [Actinoplanes sp. NPDC051470]|uniref:PadR family transcriptional regulator n=1 Tax=unclassified Actinoplanes TaxID=2626549 RepID=UPI00344738B7
MAKKTRKVGNLTALALLALLSPGEPMHPYEMATVLRRTGKEHDMAIKWGSLYTVVGNLAKHELIEPVETGRAGRRPERTRYTITDAGRTELHDWMTELVSDPAEDRPRFAAALSVLGVLSPAEAAALLEVRLAALDREITVRRSTLEIDAATVPRLFLIEEEFGLAVRAAEAEWVRGLLGELRDKTLPGLADWQAWHESGGEAPPEFRALLEDK